jgi:hypothetical protein
MRPMSYYCLNSGITKRMIRAAFTTSVAYITAGFCYGLGGSIGALLVYLLYHKMGL